MLRYATSILLVTLGLNQACSSAKHKPQAASVPALQKQPDLIEPDLTRIPVINDPMPGPVAPTPGPPQPDPMPVPTPAVPEGTPLAVQQLSMGDLNICGLMLDERVVCWGENNSLQLAFADWQSAYKDPTVMTYATKFVEVQTSSSHSCGRSREGEVFCWGINRNGIVNPASSEEYIEDIQKIEVPFVAKKIVMTSLNSCAIGEQGQAFCWGLLRFLYLPKEANERTSNSSTDVASDKPVRDIVLEQGSGSSMSCLIFTDNDARCWKKVGSATELEVSEFQEVEKIVMTAGNGCVLTRKGQIQCWGKFATASIEGGVRDIALSARHLCVIDTNQKAACMGDNGLGQLGFPVAEVKVKDALTTVPGEYRFESIAINRNMTCAIDSSKALYCWGKKHPGLDYLMDYGLDESARLNQLKNEAPTLVRWPFQGEAS